MSLDQLTVADVMRPGVIDCAPQATALEAAELMASAGVHCIVVDGLASDPNRGERLVWGILSDAELMGAAGEDRLDGPAGELAAGETVTVNPGESVREAARLMAEHECMHLVVADSQSGRPIGMISSLDVARAAVADARAAA